MIRIFLQETYELEDCLRYDDARSDKTSTYSYNGLSSLTHSTDHYEAVRNSTSQYYNPIYIDETLPSDFEISVDINRTPVPTDYQNMLTVAPNHPKTYIEASECGIVSTSSRYGLFKRINGAFTGYATNGNLSYDKWFNFKVKVEGTSVTATIIDLSNNTVIHSVTQTISDVSNWNKWNLIVGDGKYTLKWKNLKIKVL